ncbi:hypothetical protein MMC10_004782, partial [Thelotrema lepadinum]|nr:hypothetical protein [Thelotrema lepadinum]
MAQDYPRQKLRIFVLDDANDGSLQKAVLGLAKEHGESQGPRLYYLSREVKPGGNSYFKAGNLRFGIEASLRAGGSELIASLDADMIPSANWLTSLVPHLILDDNLALMGAPQVYYQFLDQDPLGSKTDFDTYWPIYEVLSDRLDASFCNGTGFVTKRAALDDIGGWPLVEYSDDIGCSNRLNSAGWKVGFARDELQFGVGPTSLRVHLKQRMSWCDSSLECHRQFGFYLPGSKLCKKMTRAQRVVRFLQAVRESTPVLTVLVLVLLPSTVLTFEGITSSTAVSEEAAIWLQVTFPLSLLARKFNTHVVFGHLSLQRAFNTYSNDI